MGHETKTRARNESERIEREIRETTNHVSRSEGAENTVTPRTKKKEETIETAPGRWRRKEESRDEPGRGRSGERNRNMPVGDTRSNNVTFIRVGCERG